MPFDGESFAGGAGANSTTSGVLKLFYRRLSAFIGG
jgi:hypothetical protein